MLVLLGGYFGTCLDHDVKAINFVTKFLLQGFEDFIELLAAEFGGVTHLSIAGEFLESLTDFLFVGEILNKLAGTVETGTTQQSDEPERIAHSRDDFPELIKVIGLILKFSYFLNVFVKAHGPFVRVVPRVVLALGVVLEPFLFL